jgi:hypothetical protein
MATDRFSALIEELSSATKIKLAPDAHNACTIRYPDKLGVRMDPDPSGEFLYVLVEVAKPGEGKYRENIMQEALRANGLPPPRKGIFCFNLKKDLLLLFDQVPFEELTGQQLADVLESLCQKARIWRDAISRGEVPSYDAGESPRAASRSEGMFGIR